MQHNTDPRTNTTMDDRHQAVVVTLKDAQQWAIGDLLNVRGCTSPTKAAAIVTSSLAKHWPKGQ